MHQPAENPDVLEYLRRRGLTIDPTISHGWTDRNNANSVIKVGDVRPEGIVVGFCRYDNSMGSALAILHNESKEGTEAVDTIHCLAYPEQPQL